MFQLKSILLVAAVMLIGANSASAFHPHRFYYGYRGPAYAYAPVVVAPPPVVVAPPYPAPVPAYVTPAPAVFAPAPAVIAPAPVVYAPPVYTYGAIGPRRFGFGYASPGFGVYVGR